MEKYTVCLEHFGYHEFIIADCNDGITLITSAYFRLFTANKYFYYALNIR